jgi:hypothetical protein
LLKDKEYQSVIENLWVYCYNRIKKDIWIKRCNEVTRLEKKRNWRKRQKEKERIEGEKEVKKRKQIIIIK